MSDERFVPITPKHAAALLAVINMAEPNRARGGGSTIAATTAQTWAGLLEGVDADFAANYLKSAYQRARILPMAPGEIVEAYRAYCDRLVQRSEQIEREQRRQRATMDTLADDVFTLAPEWVRPYYEACKVAHADGLSMPDPPPHEPTAVEPNDPDRACPVRECICTHVECYKGWLNDDMVTVARSVTYASNRRCPVCAEAVDMRETLASERPPNRPWRR
jgi:predicted nucleic acid-binding Zn ribbon protein